MFKYAEDPEEVLEDKETAKEDSTKDEQLPDLGEGADLLDPATEQPFEPALTPSKWEIQRSGDGYVVFVKTDSASDPDAEKGRYQKSMTMNTGEADEAILDYINTFLTTNNLDTSAKKHFTMRTKYGPKTIDEFDNDVSVVYDWQSGKYAATIHWRPKDSTITVPAQFKKETEIPDELSTPEEPVAEGIPSLEDMETPPAETPEKEEAPEEKPAKPARSIMRLVRLARRMQINSIITDDTFLKTASHNLSKLTRYAEVPASTDVTEIINNILGKTRNTGASAFSDYISREALGAGRLYTRDFKDLAKYRKDGDTAKLRSKEVAMADRIYGDIDRIVKSEVPDADLKNKIKAMSRQSLIDIIADNIEQISANDKSGKLFSDIKPEDIAEAPETPEPKPTAEKNPKTIVQRLVEKFYQLRGALTSSQRLKTTDIALLGQAVEAMAEDLDEGETVSDDDKTKAKQLIVKDLEGRGDLIGAP